MSDIPSGDYNAASGQPHDNDRIELTASGDHIDGANFADAPQSPGETGNRKAAAPWPSSNAEYAAKLMGSATAGSALVCSKPGDPNQGGWNPVVAADVNLQCPAFHNNYLNISRFTPDDEGKVRARKENFACLIAVMLDDVGTKVDPERLNGIKPTAEIETSPDNCQWILVLAAPITDITQAEDLLNMLVAAGLTDPGAGGVARWSRFPGGINGKVKHQQSDGTPWSCRLTQWNVELTYTPEELITRLNLKRPEKAVRLPRTRADAEPSEVFRPRADDNAVVKALKEQGLYKHELSPGKHDVTCFKVHEHTDGIDHGTAYFEPNAQYPSGGFKCQHSHGDDLKVHDLLDFLGLEEQDARHRDLIRIVPGELVAIMDACEQALARRGKLYRSGNLIVGLRHDPVTNDVTMVPRNEQMLTRDLAEAADFEKHDGRVKGYVRCDPPPRLVSMLARSEDYRHLPELKGVARQPFFRDDCSLVTEPGYDEQSGVYAAFDATAYSMPEPSLVNAEKAVNVLKELIGEFRFASPRDMATALCAILTATVRSSLALAPGFLTTATMPGSGKSYLNSVITSFVGPGESLKTSYPKSSEEATKSVLSFLMTGAAAIEFDDTQEDLRPHGIINRMFTSPALTERVLGVSKSATVPTRTFVMASGNNIQPVRDLRRRILSIKLDPRCGTPVTITYKGNPLARVRKHRARYVVAALTIIRAWMAAGSPRADAPTIASFDGAWSDWCRQPLLWQGLEDPAGSIIEQITSDPENDVLGNVLRAWFSAYGSKPVMVRTILAEISSDKRDALFEALEESPAFEREKLRPGKLGWYLKKVAGRIVDGLFIEQVKLPERTAWQVVPVDHPSPASPGAPLASDPSTPDI